MTPALELRGFRAGYSASEIKVHDASVALARALRTALEAAGLTVTSYRPG